MSTFPHDSLHVLGSPRVVLWAVHRIVNPPNSRETDDSFTYLDSLALLLVL